MMHPALLGRFVGQLIIFGVMLAGMGAAMISYSRNSYLRREAMYDDHSRRESLLAVSAVTVLGVLMIIGGIGLVVFGVTQ